MTVILKSRSVGLSTMANPSQPAPRWIGFDLAKPGGDSTKLLVVGGGHTSLHSLVKQFRGLA